MRHWKFGLALTLRPAVRAVPASAAYGSFTARRDTLVRGDWIQHLQCWKM